MSRMASPARLKASTARVIAMPLNRACHGESVTNSRPLLSISPQDTPGGPRPRNDRLASARITTPIHMLNTMMIGAVMLGRIWRIMILGAEAPMARAAST